MLAGGGLDENVLIFSSLPIDSPYNIADCLICWFSLILMLNTLRISLAHEKGPETFQ